MSCHDTTMMNAMMRRRVKSDESKFQLSPISVFSDFSHTLQLRSDSGFCTLFVIWIVQYFVSDAEWCMKENHKLFAPQKCVLFSIDRRVNFFSKALKTTVAIDSKFWCTHTQRSMKNCTHFPFRWMGKCFAVIARCSMFRGRNVIWNRIEFLIKFNSLRIHRLSRNAMLFDFSFCREKL